MAQLITRVLKGKIGAESVTYRILWQARVTHTAPRPLVVPKDHATENLMAAYDNKATTRNRQNLKRIEMAEVRRMC